MPKQDIIVIGGSAGAVEAIQTLAAGFTANLQAAVFVVLHIGNGLNGHSHLTEILCKYGPLPAKQAEDGEEIRHGRIYCARPNFHIQLEPRRVRLLTDRRRNSPVPRSIRCSVRPRQPTVRA